MNINMSNMSINGVSYSGKSITVLNGKVYIDGKEAPTSGLTIDIKVVGDIDTLEVDACSTIAIQGSVKSIRNGSGDITCDDVTGNIQCGSGDVDAHAVGGDIQTGSGDVSALEVKGSVRTGSGDIKYRR